MGQVRLLLFQLSFQKSPLSLCEILATHLNATLCIFDFLKFVYHANDASKCLIFLFKKSHKFLSSLRRYSKIFQYSQAYLVILTNFLAGKLLRHIDLVDFWHHHQTGHCRNKLMI